jgi:mannose-6-phosphate isomerase-like protein (cupin superfamily)
MSFPARRVVTGRAADGRSTVLSDGPSPCRVDQAGSGISAELHWWSEGGRADNGGNEDAAARPFPTSVSPAEGAAFIIVRYPPLATAGAASRTALQAGGIPTVHGRRPGMHATDSLDYVIVMAGEITMILEDREVALHAGDTVIDRGVMHAWENRGETDAVLASVTIGAIPLGDATGIC